MDFSYFQMQKDQQVQSQGNEEIQGAISVDELIKLADSTMRKRELQEVPFQNEQSLQHSLTLVQLMNQNKKNVTVLRSQARNTAIGRRQQLVQLKISQLQELVKPTAPADVDISEDLQDIFHEEFRGPELKDFDERYNLTDQLKKFKVKHGFNYRTQSNQKLLQEEFALYQQAIQQGEEIDINCFRHVLPEELSIIQQIVHSSGKDYNTIQMFVKKPMRVLVPIVNKLSHMTEEQQKEIPALPNFNQVMADKLKLERERRQMRRDMKQHYQFDVQPINLDQPEPPADGEQIACDELDDLLDGLI